MSGYVYAEFLRAVQAHQIHERGRTEPTGCWVCDVLLPLQGMAGVSRSWATEIARCAHVSGITVDAHHLLPKRVLKESHPRGIRLPPLPTAVRWVPGDEIPRAVPMELPRDLTLDDLLMDPRNGIIVRRYHHDALEHRTIAIPKSLWPGDAIAFARELGLEWWIDNMEARRA